MRTLTQIKFQSLFVNCKLQTPAPQSTFKGMISDSFLQSTENMKGQDEEANVWICDAHSSMNGVGSSAKAVLVNLGRRWTK